MFENRFYRWYIPGQRIIKTAVAVTLCLICYMLMGYRGKTMPAEAAITAIICMQPFFQDTTKGSIDRLFGTVLGALFGFLFLLLMMAFPGIGKNRVLLYVLMGFGIVVSLHSAVVLRYSDAAGLSAIVFVCVVIAYPDIENPMDQAFHRILDVLLGTTVAILVNAVYLPRVRHREKVFFLHLNCLRNNRFSKLSPLVLFHIRKMCDNGMRVCMISEYAPAFQMSQLGDIHFNAPMIVMDGAAIFDPNENKYVSVTNIPAGTCRWLIKFLDSNSYFIYTIHNDRNCIYHHGMLTDLEQKVQAHLQRSPYRYYMGEDHFSVSDIVSFKIVSTEAEVDRIRRELEPMLSAMKIRCVVRHQEGVDEGYSLYVFAEHADIAHAKKHVLRLMGQMGNSENVFEFGNDDLPVSEVSALNTVRRLRDEYEPYAFVEFFRKLHRAVVMRKQKRHMVGDALTLPMPKGRGFTARFW